MAEEKVTKVKKKKWIEVISPELLGKEVIGEIPSTDAKLIIGKTITINLMSLTRDIKKQNVGIKFIITDVKEDKALTEFYGYYLNPTSIRRLVRKGKEKIEVSIVCKTSDNKKVRIMPLIIPAAKVNGSVAAAFRKNAVDYLRSYVAKTTFENIIKDLVNNRVQKELKAALKKIYPVRILEVAKLHIETDKKHVEKEIKVEVKEEEPEEEVEEEKVKEKKETPNEKESREETEEETHEEQEEKEEPEVVEEE